MTSTRLPDSGRNSTWRSWLASWRGTVTSPAWAVMLDNRLEADCTSSEADLSGFNSARIRATAASSRGLTCSRLSTKKR